MVDWTHHHAGGDGDPSPAVGVGDDVSVAHAEEGDGYQPHCVEEVGVFLVMVPKIYRDCRNFSAKFLNFPLYVNGCISS